MATARGRLENVALVPADAQAHPVAVQAIEGADWVVLGPGSWYSSVLPHLILPSMRRALLEARARRVLILNLSAQHGETDGMTAADHVRVLADCAPDLRLDVILADPLHRGGHRGAGLRGPRHGRHARAAAGALQRRAVPP